MKLKEPDWRKKIVRIKSKGLTQKDIEKASGVEQQTVSKMERGLYKRASWVIGNAINKLEKRLFGK
jgi:transcriptional regulator with XRE-family HTH domain